MKKTNLILAVIAAGLTIISCTKEDPIVAPAQEAQETQEAREGLNINISVQDINGAPQTKAVKTNWTDGDKIFIWFENNDWHILPEVTLTYNGGKWESSSTVDPATLKTSGGELWAIYEASNSLFETAVNNDYYKLPYVMVTYYQPYTYQTSAPFMNLMVSTKRLAYTYDSASKTLTSTLSGWFFNTRCQVTVTGLPEGKKASDYILFSEDLYKADSFKINKGMVYMATSRNGACVGAESPDGAAFFFAQNFSANKRDYTFTLREITADKSGEMKCIKKDKIWLCSETEFSAISIPFSDFTKAE